MNKSTNDKIKDSYFHLFGNVRLRSVEKIDISNISEKAIDLYRSYGLFPIDWKNVHRKYPWFKSESKDSKSSC